MTPEDFICSVYSGLMESGFNMPSIDKMDIMFYFDILAFRKREEDREIARKYDSMGV